MGNVIIQPTGSDEAYSHFVNTIQKPVLLNPLRQYLSNQDISILSKIYPAGRVPIWGVTSGARNINFGKWSKIAAGDLTLFTGKKKAFASGTVTYKTHSASLAQNLWGLDPKGNAWEYIYFLDEIRSQNVPYERLATLLNYSPNYDFYNFNVLNNSACQRIFQVLGLESHTHVPEVTEKDFEGAVDRLAELETLDSEALAKGRIEQAFLRRRIFGNNSVAKCGICGREFPIELLVAAHIKKRACCTTDERLDFRNIVMPMCLFGCDRLYENGYITIEDGMIKGLVNEAPQAVLDYIRVIKGKNCSHWNDNSRHYFLWHSQFHKSRQRV